MHSSFGSRRQAVPVPCQYRGMELVSSLVLVGVIAVLCVLCVLAAGLQQLQKLSKSCTSAVSCLERGQTEQWQQSAQLRGLRDAVDAMALASGASVPMGDGGVRSLAGQISEFLTVSELRSTVFDDRSNAVLTQLQELVAVQQQMLDLQSDIKKTNQISASLNQQMEWRTCLEFGSKWHKCSVHYAYRLWQLQQLRSPTIPQNQWRVDHGEPMGAREWAGLLAGPECQYPYVACEWATRWATVINHMDAVGHNVRVLRYASDQFRPTVNTWTEAKVHAVETWETVLDEFHDWLHQNPEYRDYSLCMRAQTSMSDEMKAVIVQWEERLEPYDDTGWPVGLAFQAVE